MCTLFVRTRGANACAAGGRSLPGSAGKGAPEAVGRCARLWGVSTGRLMNVLR